MVRDIILIVMALMTLCILGNMQIIRYTKSNVIAFIVMYVIATTTLIIKTILLVSKF